MKVWVCFTNLQGELCCVLWIVWVRRCVISAGPGKSKRPVFEADLPDVALIVLQALAQYLVNLNVWTHNVLTILARRKALQSSSRCNVQCAGVCHLQFLAKSFCLCVHRPPA